MTELILAALLLAVLAFHAWQSHRWSLERAALLERLVPGLVVTEQEQPTLRSGFLSDEEEADIEDRRLAEFRKRVPDLPQYDEDE